MMLNSIKKGLSTLLILGLLFPPNLQAVITNQVPKQNVTGSHNDNCSVFDAASEIPIFKVYCPPYGAVGDFEEYEDGELSTGTPTLTSASRSCASSDVGKMVAVKESATATLLTDVSACSGTDFTLSDNATVTDTGLTWQIGTNDQDAIQAAFTAAAAVPAAIVDFGNRSYYHAETVSNVRLDLTNSEGWAKFTGAGAKIVRFPEDGTTSSVFTTRKLDTFILEGGIEIDGNNPMLPSNYTLQRVGLDLGNRHNYILNGAKISNASAVGIQVLATTVAGEIPLETFVMTDSSVINAWRDVIFFGGTRENAFVYIAGNNLTATIHPNHGSFSYQGPNGPYIEPNAGLEGEGDYQAFIVVNNSITLVSASGETAHCIAAASLTGALIQYTNWSHNRCNVSGATNSQILRLNAGSKDSAGDRSVVIIDGNDLFQTSGSLTTVIDIISGATTNREYILHIINNAIRGSLSSSANALVTVAADLTAFKAFNNSANIASFTDWFSFAEDVGQLEVGNNTNGNRANSGSETRLTAAKTYGFRPGGTYYFLRTEPGDGNAVAIGEFQRSASPPVSPVLRVTIRRWAIEKVYYVTMPVLPVNGWYRVEPIISSGPFTGIDFHLDVNADTSTNDFNLRLRQVGANQSESFKVAIEYIQNRSVEYGVFVPSVSTTSSATITGRYPVITDLAFLSPGRGGIFQELTWEEALTLAAAATSDTTNTIGANSRTYGVVFRINTTITGCATVDAGISGATNRFGTFSALTAGTQLTSTDNSAYASATAIRFSCVGGGGSFTAGVIRVIPFYYSLTPPTE